MKTPPISNGAGGGRVAHLKPEESRELSDPALERAFLGSALYHPDILLASEIVEGDFYSGAHARTFAAMLALLAEGEPVNTVSLVSKLHERGHLAAVGGETFVLDLTNVMPERDGPWLRIRKLAARRTVAELARIVAGKAGDEDEFTRYFDQLVAARERLAAIDAGPVELPTLGECVPKIAEFGPRLSLGLPGLDEATRGGLPAGKIVLLLGAPGSSKTNYSTYLADSWERAGCAVVILAADESRESIVTRLGQLDGHPRELLEGEDDGRRNAFIRNAAGRSIYAIDPFADKISLEEAHRHLVRLAGNDRPRVLVVDSVQTVPCDAADELETPTEVVKAVMLVLDGFARAGTTIVAISEMSRAGYRTGARDKDISALGAGAESRKVEFTAHLLLGLRPVKDAVGQVDVEIAKNRLGPAKGELRMSLDFETLRFRELAKPDVEEEQAVREAVRDNAVRTRLLATIRANPELRAGHALARLAKVNKRDGLAVLRELVAEGVVSKVDGCFRISLSPHGEQD